MAVDRTRWTKTNRLSLSVCRINQTHLAARFRLSRTLLTCHGCVELRHAVHGALRRREQTGPYTNCNPIQEIPTRYPRCHRRLLHQSLHTGTVSRHLDSRISLLFTYSGGASSYCREPTVISCHGAFEPTKIWYASGRLGFPLTAPMDR